MPNPTISDKMPSLRVQIYQLIKEKRGNKVHSGDIERFALLNNYKASNGDRRARQLVQEYETKKGVRVKNPYYCPEIKHIIEDKSVVYWYEEPQKQNPASIYKCSHPTCPRDAVKYLGNEPRCPQHLLKIETNHSALF